jgi:hypothetical protein
MRVRFRIHAIHVVVDNNFPFSIRSIVGVADWRVINHFSPTAFGSASPKATTK